MKLKFHYFLITLFVLPIACIGQNGSTATAPLVQFSPDFKTNTNIDKQLVAELTKLMETELTFILRQDTVAMKSFFPDDTRVTNPFNQFIGKNKIIERMKADVIKYSSYQKTVEFLHLEGGDVAVAMGLEVVVPTADANRDDRGKTVKRRFTEVWMKRGNEWKKVVRHASNM